MAEHLNDLHGPENDFKITHAVTIYISKIINDKYADRKVFVCDSMAVSASVQVRKIIVLDSNIRIPYKNDKHFIQLFVSDADNKKYFRAIPFFLLQL